MLVISMTNGCDGVFFSCDKSEEVRSVRFTDATIADMDGAKWHDWTIVDFSDRVEGFRDVRHIKFSHWVPADVQLRSRRVRTLRWSQCEASY
jgi:hypothetical protein